MTSLQPVPSLTRSAPLAPGELPFDDSMAFARADAQAGMWSFPLGYGGQWDALLQHVLDAFLSGFENLPVMVQGHVLHVHPPYLINVDNERLRRAKQHRQQATGNAAALPGGLQRGRAMALLGKGTPEQLQAILQSVVDGNLLAGTSLAATADGLRDWLIRFGVGIDCSGFVSQALNALMRRVLNRDLDPAERISTNAAGLNARIDGPHNFDTLARPGDLRPGDTMGYPGHIRIVTRVDVQSDGSVVFLTAESSSSGNNATPYRRDIGPTARRWRIGSQAAFGNLQRDDSADPAGPPHWVAGDRGKTVTFSRYKRLRDAIAARPASVAQALPFGGATPSISVADATQDLTARAANRRFANADEINAFFAGLGAEDFIDWYNRMLGGRGPFAARARIDARTARPHFAQFWQSPQIRLLYGQPTVRLLDFVALSCISINETNGSLASHPEIGGHGRLDEHGVRHEGLAYLYDGFRFQKGGGKISYNTAAHALGNLSAGQLFRDPEFVHAHRHLALGDRLNGENGTDGIDARWDGAHYPVDRYPIVENAHTSGFIMQADFYKFRGRGLIQVTGRLVYRRLVEYVCASYDGSNGAILARKRQWNGRAADTVATESNNDDWDALFGEKEFLAASVLVHSRLKGGYLSMSDQAAQLNMHARSATGSIFRMGACIGGANYAQLYRNRVLAMLNMIGAGA
ncbi:hypothetical protein [Burkholderia ubonensis]|uniref:hypothetical protein n=1 Tax=Burkholderia ubonensis TaxID=101571 RepID=UPI000B0CF056|nr:hypothetical protein [Burkholderia ubonensis]